jgi:tetratricopeptide (TPR) repeat protein
MRGLYSVGVSTILLLSVFLLSLVQGPLLLSSEKMKERIIGQEVLYLPQVTAFAPLSLGYRNVLSDVFWFTTINYFGAHLNSDRNYKWLAHRCHLVTELKPKAFDVYSFCALMLAWEQNDPKAAINLLNRATDNFPDNWEFYYYRGFYYLYFLKDELNAKNDFLSASKLPGVPELVVALAARKTLDLENEQQAESILSEILNNNRDPIVKDVIERKLKEYRKKNRHHEQ